MKAIVSIAVIAFSGVFAQHYSVSRGLVSDKVNCYAFQIPKGWVIAQGNSIPLMFDFPPGRKPFVGQDFPADAASLSIMPGSESAEKPRSIDQWMSNRGRGPYYSKKEIRYPSSTGITRAVEVRWVEKGGIEKADPVYQKVDIFFVFQGKPFAAFLMYEKGDKRSAKYQASLNLLMSGFRPVGGSSVCAKRN